PPKPDRLEGFARALAQLVVLGQPIAFRALYAGQGRQVASLPITPLVTEPYWAVDPDRAVPLVPEGLDVPKGTAGGAPNKFSQSEPSMSQNTPSAELIALFREQNEILRQHAAILAQQAAVLGGGAVPVAATAAAAAPAAASAAASASATAAAPAAASATAAAPTAASAPAAA